MSSSTVSSIAGDSRQPSERRHVDHLTERLEHINEQLAKVRQERLQLSATKVRTSRSNNSSFRDLKIPLKRKRAIPRRSGIPSSSMDYLIAEVVYSPYMTKPGQPYSQEVYRVPEKLKALKQQRLDLKSLPKDAQPFDLDEVKGTFKEITNYNTSFVKARKRKENSPSSSSTCVLSVGSSKDLHSQAGLNSRSLPELKPRRTPSAQAITPMEPALAREVRAHSEDCQTCGAESSTMLASQSHDPHLESYADDFEDSATEALAATTTTEANEANATCEPLETNETEEGIQSSVVAPEQEQAGSAAAFSNAAAPNDRISDQDLALLFSSLAQIANIMHLAN